MNFRILGQTGLRVSEISLGSMMFGWRVSGEEVNQIVDLAADAGINLIDTSNSYGKGKSEELVGAALARHRKRDQFILATKFHYWKEGDDPLFQNSVQKHIVKQCEDSLKRLRTDVIDLYQLHRPSSAVPIEETLLALDLLVKQGKVRWIGTSTFAAWQLVESRWISEISKLCRFSCEQTPYNLLDRTIEKELLPMAQTFGMGILAYAPLAEGALTGKYRRDSPFPEDSRFARVTRPDGYSAKLTPEVFTLIEKLEALAMEKNISLSCLALAWCLKNPVLSTLIVGVSKIHHVHELMKSLDVTFSTEDIRRIDAISPPEQCLSPYYKADFGPHAFRKESMIDKGR